MKKSISLCGNTAYLFTYLVTLCGQCKHVPYFRNVVHGENTLPIYFDLFYIVYCILKISLPETGSVWNTWRNCVYNGEKLICRLAQYKLVTSLYQVSCITVHDCQRIAFQTVHRLSAYAVFWMGGHGLSIDYSVHEAWNEATNVYLLVILVSFGLLMYARKWAHSVSTSLFRSLRGHPNTVQSGIPFFFFKGTILQPFTLKRAISLICRAVGQCDALFWATKKIKQYIHHFI